MDVVSYLRDLIASYGVLGIFLVSLLSNSMPYAFIPYLILILHYSAAVTDPAVRLAITIASALGATIGKLVVYYVGRVTRVVLSDKARRATKIFSQIARRSLFIAILLFASLPLPDDVLYIPLGLSSYNATAYVLAVLIGKLILTGTIVYFGALARELLLESLYIDNVYASTAILIAITLALSYVVVSIDWVNVVATYSDKGFTASLKYFLNELIRVLGLMKIKNSLFNKKSV
ncbi:MAG: VTT domain-containing protein [Sulfolobales archaeon]|nr:VTT domain-containing protein [Sulfolobales archaeon]MCX8199247.1 VTT domain-containing protein [Sulfolobales archaeon]MDW8170439.1 VTT domain-containing protein [Desulfurococcaceae archaeon]